jgi:predicted DNA-binding protein (MmcQ/YjbR family)
MKFEIEKVGGIGDYREEKEAFFIPEGKAFLVLHNNTIEIRTDDNLRKLLMSKYESVMQSRYFGRGGIEVVLSGQLPESEIYDLVRLSYNLTKEKDSKTV